MFRRSFFVHCPITLAPGPLSLCLLAAAAWTGLMVQAGRAGLWPLMGLSILGLAAFLAGALIGTLPIDKHILGHIDAAAAGGVLAAAILLGMPHALRHDTGAGALGLSIGLGLGVVLYYAGASRGGRSILAVLSLHTVCAGMALGALYYLLPTLGWAIGIAVLGHKAPAGYVLIRRLESTPRDTILVVLPGLGTGLGALSIAIMQPTGALPAGIILGAAAGLFTVVALAFLASGAVGRRRQPADWAAFVAGATVIVATGLGSPHGI